MRKWCLAGLVLAVVLGSVAFGEEAEPSWVAPMKKAHEGFDGTPNYVAQLGDSITYSMAFWKPITWADCEKYIPADDGLPKSPKEGRWKNLIQGGNDKGGKFGNYSGWRIGNLLGVIDKVLADQKPEVAIIMIGTNDISGGKVGESYKTGLEKVVEKCIAAHCVPILNTIPPKKGKVDAAQDCNKIIKEVAEKFNVPLADYYAEIEKRQPGDACFGTLISGDGVHPSAGNTGDYSEENLKKSGYALRTWVNFLMLRQVYFRVLHPDEMAK